MKGLLSLLLSLALVLTLLPEPVQAEVGKTASDGLCPHHMEHRMDGGEGGSEGFAGDTASCGYKAPTEGSPCQHIHDSQLCYLSNTVCIHQHDAGCYSDGILPAEGATGAEGETKTADVCTHVCTEESGCMTRELKCGHVHDETCGYTAADPGQPCRYVCKICPVQAMIDALPEPDSMTVDQISEVEGLLTAVDEAKNGLTDEENGQLDMLRYDALAHALTALKGESDYSRELLANSEVLDVSQGFARITEDGNYTITGESNSNNIIVENGARANITLENVYIDVSSQDAKAAMDLRAAGACTIITKAGTTNTLKSGSQCPGVYVPEKNQITFKGEGTLKATGATFWPGIGRNGNGNILIESGTINASGGATGAGIGASNGFDSGTITIAGGNITATGGQQGAGIGGGAGSSGVYVTITGGEVTANGGGLAAGIGSGNGGSNINVTITGGEVRAVGGQGGAGIGSGVAVKVDADVQICNITITGGSVTAEAGLGAEAVGLGNGNTGAWGVVHISGDAARIYGTLAIPSANFEIPSDKTVTVDSGTTLVVRDGITMTVNGTLQVDGTIQMNSGTLQVSDKGKLTGTGSISPEQARLAASITNLSITPSSGVVGSHTAPIVAYDYNGDATPEVKWYKYENGKRGDPVNGPDASAAAGTYQVAVSAAATGLYQEAAEVTALYTLKNEQAAPIDGEGYTIDFKTRTMTIDAGYEVNTTAQFDNATMLQSGAEITVGATSTYYIRKAETETDFSSPYTSFTAKPSADYIFEISNAEDLKNFAKLVNEGKLTNLNGKLMNNITVNPDLDQSKFVISEGNVTYDGGAVPDTFEQWTPIGSEADYIGTFDGNGCTVSGLYINDADRDTLGMFGCIVGTGTVKKLAVENSFIRGGNRIGSVVGSNSGIIENCNNSGTVAGLHIGGVVGWNDFNGTIKNCYNTGEIAGDMGAGGVAYQNFGSIENCYNTGAIKSSSYIGGVVGMNGGSGTIKNCYNIGNVTGRDYVGGVVSYNEGSLENCYNTGSITGNTCVGGVVGVNSHLVVSNCYNTGTISGTGNTGAASFIGGVCGRNMFVTFTNCYYLQGTAEKGVGSGTSDASDGVTALTIAQFEASDQLLNLLNGNPSAGVWKDQCCAMGTWTYGKPAVQPVLSWQAESAANIPAYTVTIPETVEIGSDSTASGQLSVNAGNLRQSQQVQVTLDRSNAFHLSTSEGADLGYQIFAGNNTPALSGGDRIMDSGNTQTAAETTLRFVMEKPKFSGTYNGTVTFKVSVSETQP